MKRRFVWLIEVVSTALASLRSRREEGGHQKLKFHPLFDRIGSEIVSQSSLRAVRSVRVSRKCIMKIEKVMKREKNYRNFNEVRVKFVVL